MSLSSFNRKQIEQINRQTLRYPLDMAAKDYFLALALQIICDSPLRETLVFKGGAALHHCYLPQSRCSDALHFTSLHPELQMQEVVDILEASEVFSAHWRHQTTHALKVEKLHWVDRLGEAGTIRLGIDINLPVIQPVISRTYTNVWSLPITLPTMDVVEICAETIMKARRRARYQDFYDLYLVVTEGHVAIEDVLAILVRKEGSYPLSKLDLLTRLAGGQRSAMA